MMPVMPTCIANANVDDCTLGRDDEQQDEDEEEKEEEEHEDEDEDKEEPGSGRCRAHEELCEETQGDAWEQCMLQAPKGCYEGGRERDEDEGGYGEFGRCKKEVFRPCEEEGGDWMMCVEKRQEELGIVCLEEEAGRGEFLQECFARAEEEFKARAAEAGFTEPHEGFFKARARQMCAGQGFEREHMPPGPPRFEEQEGPPGVGGNAALILSQAAGTIVELSQRPNMPEAVKILLVAAARAVGESLMLAAKGEPFSKILPAVEGAINPVLAAIRGTGFGPGGPGGPGYGSPGGEGMMGPGFGPPGMMRPPGMEGGPGMMMGGGPMMFMPDVSQVEPQVKMMLAMMEKMFRKVEQAFARMGDLLDVDFGGNWKDDLADLREEFGEVKENCTSALASGDFRQIQEGCFEALARFPERMERFKEYAMKVVEEEDIPGEKVGKAMQTVEQEIFSDMGPRPDMMEGGMGPMMPGEFRGGMMPGGMMGPGMQEFFTKKGECFQRMAEGHEAVEECMRKLMEEMGGGMGPMMGQEGMPFGEGFPGEGRFGPGFMREGGMMGGGRFEEMRRAMEACKEGGKSKEECMQEVRGTFEGGQMREGGFPEGGGEGMHRMQWKEGESPQNPYFRGGPDGGGHRFPWGEGMMGPGMPGGIPGMQGGPGMFEGRMGPSGGMPYPGGFPQGWHPPEGEFRPPQ